MSGGSAKTVETDEIFFFSSYISAFGKAGKSFVPLGVHLRITLAPNIASFATI